MKPKLFNCSWIDINKIDLPCEVDLYNNILKIRDGDQLKVLMVFSEPECFRIRNSQIIANHKNYDIILAHDPHLLKKCRNCVKFLFGTTWIIDDHPDKQFELSFLCGNKNKTIGHKLRHKLWDRSNEIKIPKSLWASHNSNLSNKKLSKELSQKIRIFGSQFSIAIENLKINNYFTEKLIDCFKTKTVPIYWGCPNIGKYFNINGIIVCGSIDDIINKCNRLNESSYDSMIEAIEENYDRSKEYWGVEHRLQKAICQFIKRKTIGG